MNDIKEAFKTRLPWGGINTARAAGVVIHSHPGKQIDTAFEKLDLLRQIARANGFDLHIEIRERDFNAERKLYTTLDNMLELVSIAGDFGFYKPILMQAFAEIIGEISDDEIELYAQSVGNDEGYTIEDYESIKAILIDFRQNYMGGI